MLILLALSVWKLNLRHMRAVAAIDKMGSVSAAAQAVNISQPAITQGLAKLEGHLGQRLFDRQPDGMSATEAGTLFIPRIDAALKFVPSSRVTMTQVKALIVLADTGSYMGAAQMTGLSGPSLHRAISDLSIALGSDLVERRGNGIALTDKGKSIARTFRLARAELAAGLSELLALMGRETGKIVIGAMPLSRARILPAAISVFHRRHPKVQIGIMEGAFHELIEPLRDGAIDLMIGALRDPSLEIDIDQKFLFEDRTVVLGRKAHPAAGRHNQLAQLADYSWILPARGTPLRKQWEDMFVKAGLDLPSVPIESGSVIVIRQILLDSDFLTLLSPDQVAVELEAGWLARIAETPAHMIRNIGISTRRNWCPTTKQSEFLNILASTAS